MINCFNPIGETVRYCEEAWKEQMKETLRQCQEVWKGSLPAINISDELLKSKAFLKVQERINRINRDIGLRKRDED